MFGLIVFMNLEEPICTIHHFIIIIPNNFITIIPNNSIMNMFIDCRIVAIRNIQGTCDWYPSKPLLDLARKKGVFIGGLGSDAHAPDQLAVDFEIAHILVHETFPHLYED